MNKTVLTLMTLTLIACGSGDKRSQTQTITSSEALPETPTQAIATLESPQQKVIGTVTFRPEGEEILTTIMIKGLRPNSSHGIHIHEVGKCDGPDFKSADDHFNPAGHKHGGPQSKQKHLGDLGNINTDKKGNARKEVRLKGPHANLEAIMERSVVLHAKTDDYRTQPSGNSGDRIACGLITAAD